MDDLTPQKVRAAAAGDHEARHWLIETYSPLLLSQAEWRVRGSLERHVAAMDLVQEVWLTILDGRLAKMAADEEPWRRRRFLKYLSTTLRNHLSNLRKKLVKRGADGLPLYREGEERSRVFASLAAEVTSVTQGARRREDHVALLDAISNLPDTFREIVVLRGIEQQSLDEVADWLEITKGAAAVRYHRALGRLRDALGGRLPDWLPPAPDADETADTADAAGA